MASERLMPYGENTRFPVPPTRPSNARANRLVELTAVAAGPVVAAGGVGAGCAARRAAPQPASAMLRATTAAARRIRSIRRRRPEHLGQLGRQREVALERGAVAQQ